MTPSENSTFPSTQSESAPLHGNGPDAELSRMERQLATARQKMADTMVAVQDRSHQMIDTASGTIQRWPLTALTVATAVGVVIGYMLAESIAESRTSRWASLLRRQPLAERWHW